MSASSSQQSNASSSSSSSSSHSHNYTQHYSYSHSHSKSYSSNYSYNSKFSQPDKTRVDEWSQPYEVDDEDICFDGEPLSALFEKEHRPQKEEQRGRRKKRDAH